MAGKFPATKKERWLHRGTFIFLGALLLALTWIQFKNEQKKEAVADEKVPAINNNPTVVRQPPQKESQSVEPNQTALQEKYQSLLSELATNRSLDPNLRERIIIAKTKLERETRGSNSIQPEMDLSAAQSAKNKILPYFDYAIKTLAEMSDNESVMKRDKSVLIYRGLPGDLNPGSNAGKRFMKNAAEIKLQKNADWDFKIDFAEELEPEYQASLSVACKVGVAHLRNSGDAIETRVEIFGGKSFRRGPASGDEAKGNIAEAVGKLMTSELDATVTGR